MDTPRVVLPDDGSYMEYINEEKVEDYRQIKTLSPSPSPEPPANYLQQHHAHAELPLPFQQQMGMMPFYAHQQQGMATMGSMAAGGNFLAGTRVDDRPHLQGLGELDDYPVFFPHASQFADGLPPASQAHFSTPRSTEMWLDHQSFFPQGPLPHYGSFGHGHAGHSMPVAVHPQEQQPHQQQQLQQQVHDDQCNCAREIPPSFHPSPPQTLPADLHPTRWHTSSLQAPVPVNSQSVPPFVDQQHFEQAQYGQVLPYTQPPPQNQAPMLPYGSGHHNGRQASSSPDANNHRHLSRQGAPSPASCSGDDSAWPATPADPPALDSEDSLYAPAILPAVMRRGQWERYQQHKQEEVAASSSFASTEASTATAWSPAASVESLASMPYAASAPQALVGLQTANDPRTVDPTMLSRTPRRRSAPSVVGSVQHGQSWKVTKEQKPATTPFARSLTAWVDRHHGQLPPLNPAARRSLSVMLPVPEPEQMAHSTTPRSATALTPSVCSATPVPSLDVESDGLPPGMNGLSSMADMDTVGIAPSMIFGGSSSRDGTTSPNPAPFMGHQTDDGKDDYGNRHASSSLPFAQDSPPRSLTVSSSCSSDSSRSRSPSARPSPEQHVTRLESEEEVDPMSFVPEPPRALPRVKLPRPPSPQVYESQSDDDGSSEEVGPETEPEDDGEDEHEEREAVHETNASEQAVAKRQAANKRESAPRQAPGRAVASDESEALRLQQAERARQDAFLVQQRRAGLTYKEIRKLGNFEEAESTLRGRFRTLTKPKEERVRRPRWTDNDDRLLCAAVRRLARDGWPPSGNVDAPLRLSWKAVSEDIAENGGSYKFGNTTCHKRWTELRQQRRV